MKQNIHPEYRLVIFKDISSNFRILTRSTLNSDETEVWEEDGHSYPVIRIEISSASHPFYTGKQRIIDTENRVSEFERKIKQAQKGKRISKKAKREKRREKVREIKAQKRLTLKDMLKDLQ